MENGNARSWGHSLADGAAAADSEAEFTKYVLREAAGAVAELLARDGRKPSSLVVRAGGVDIELAWTAAAAPERPAQPEPAGEEAGTAPPGHWFVPAPTVGVFYRAPSPGAEPFVDVGSIVQAGQQLGIVEAMKLMIPVEADRDGRVVAVPADDGEPVEHGQRLFEIGPS
ncbi:acetyl-CoA carboxylase biotin carboxyl carrier protein [Amycolatopsis sp. NPDC054798]